MTKKAPVKATGGGGYCFEDHCAALFAIDLLSDRQPLGHEVGRVIRIDFQVQESAWLFDDLVITFASTVGERSVAISIKSDRQVNRNGFSRDFVEDAWRQWHGADGCPFRRDHDLLALVVGEIANGVKNAWDRFSTEASHPDPARASTRFTTRGQSSQIARNLFASLRCPSGLHDLGEHDDLATVRLAKHLRLLHFDFQARPSSQEADALSRCQALLESGCADEATRLWKRLVAIASEQRPVGGTLDLAKLLALLRTEFELKDHPDCEADWRQLAEFSEQRITRVRDVVGDGLRLDRKGRCDSITMCLLTTPIVALVGESGVGKSAIARQISEQEKASGKVVWLDADALDCPDDLGIRQHLGISHALSDILTACASRSALLVLDGIDRFSPNALKNAASLCRSVIASNQQSPSIWRLILTAEAAGWQRCLPKFAAVNVDLGAAKVESILFPAPDEIDSLLSKMPSLRGLANRRELGLLLRNLKILDFVALSSQAFADDTLSSWTTESDVLDWLWGYWTDADFYRHARSELLKKVGEEEGSGLATSVATKTLDQAESLMLGSLEQRHVLRVQDERVRFAHDLIGDLARLRVLIGANNDAQVIRDHALQPRWHRAVRLYGLRLLEQQQNGVLRWQQTIAQVTSDDDASVIARDLLLEAPVFSVNANRLLEQTWPVLLQGDASLLYRLLKAFLHSCTFPDPRIPLLAEKPSDAGLYASFMRVPYGPHWLPVLRLLYRHVDDVVSRPGLFASVSKVCSLWLRTVPIELAAGHKWPGRIEAATLSLRMAREVQCLKAEQVHFEKDLDQHVYEAALLGASDLPAEVAELALELARRREPSREVQTRADAYRRSEQERLRKLASDPEYQARLARMPVGLGPVTRGQKRDPWPDGPSEHVDNAFQEVCLGNVVAFQSLVQARPAVAKELLLATCIEPPGYEDPYDSDPLDQCGTESTCSAHPGMYFQGPFLAFLRAQPADGLDTIIRLVNFATQRWVSVEAGHARYWGQKNWTAPEISVQTNSGARRWLGDHRVYGWYRNLLISADLVASALMALEKWLYDEVDAEHDINPYIETILARSESVAFAGVLVAVGLRTPSLFEGPLLPLLGTWQLFEWHNHLLFDGTVWQIEMMSWVRLGEPIYNLVREWHLLPHRKESLRDRAVVLTLTRPSIAEFFVQARQCWQQERENSPYRNSLDLLIARFDPDNYRRLEQPDGTEVFELEWPEQIRERTEAALLERQQSLAVMNFPVHCRMLLDGEKALSDTDVDGFWSQLQAISGTTLDDEHEEVLDFVKSSVCGGVAVLLTNHAEWLAKHPDKLDWCQQQLMDVIESPPQRSELEIAESLNTLRWDSFVAEALVAILSIDTLQKNVRSHLAAFVTGFYYSTTGVAMKAAFRLRNPLGDDFVRLQNLAIMWSGLRAIIQRASQLRLDCTRWHVWKERLVEAFENQRISSDPVAWARIGRIAGLGLHRIEKARQRLLDWDCVQPDDTPNEAANGLKQRRRRSRLHPGLDIQLLQSTFDWIPPLRQASSATERIAWLRLLKNALDVTISMFHAEMSEEDEDEVDGAPYRYDSWVFQKLAVTITQMRSDEHPEELWKPVLNLGPSAHYWVSSFLGDWFVSGTRAAESATVFVDRWKEMIEWAFASDTWTEGKRLGYRLPDLWIELMGLGLHSRALDNENFHVDLGSLSDQYRRFAKRWLKRPHVASAFAGFLARPAGLSLRVLGIAWLADAVQSFDLYDWRDDRLEANLVEALRACWLTNSNQIRTDPGLRSTFLVLLGKLIKRQNSGAFELRDEVLRAAGT